MLKSENKALETRKRVFSFVWFVPILALIVTGLLLWSSFFNKGELITLESLDATGIEAEKTLVKFRSVTVGKVESVSLAKNRQKVEIKVRMNPNEDELLREDTKFYVIKPRVQSSNISGLETILSGNYIQLSLGVSNKYSDHFSLQDQIPTSGMETDALLLSLISQSGRRIKNGDPVSYRGFVVGEVNSADLDPQTGKINYQVSIHAKYRSLVGSQTVFWINSGLDFSMGLQGVSFRTENLQNLLSGGITFDDLYDHGTQVQNGHVTKLYESFNLASSGALEEHPHYVVMLDPEIGALKEGVLVKFRGIPIGQVTNSPWYQDPNSILSESAKIPVRIALSLKGIDDIVLRKKLNQYLEQGRLSASLGSSSLLVANDTLSLNVSEKKGHNNKTLQSFRGEIVIPLKDSSSVNGQLNTLLAHLNKIDFEKLSVDADRSLKDLSSLLKEFTRSSRELNQAELFEKSAELISKLQATLDLLNGNTTQGLVAELHSTLVDIRDLVNSLKPAANMIGQKPNSIIFDNSQEDPQPGATLQ